MQYMLQGGSSLYREVDIAIYVSGFYTLCRKSKNCTTVYAMYA